MDNGTSLELLAKLGNERERLSRLAHLIARKQDMLRDAARGCGWASVSMSSRPRSSASVALNCAS